MSAVQAKKETGMSKQRVFDLRHMMRLPDDYRGTLLRAL
jgi:hypothetical protein